METTLEDSTSTQINVEYLKPFADSGGNAVIRDNSGEKNEVTSSPAISRDSQEFISENARFFKEAMNGLADECKAWSDGAYLKANLQLWSLMAKAYSYYIEHYYDQKTAAQKEVKATLEVLLESIDLGSRKNARVLNQIVFYVFGGETPQSRRYSQALTICADDKLKANQVFTHLQDKGGVEGVIEAAKTKSPLAMQEKQKFDKAFDEVKRDLVANADQPFAMLVDIPIEKNCQATLIFGRIRDGRINLVEKIDYIDYEKDAITTFFASKLAKLKVATANKTKQVTLNNPSQQSTETEQEGEVEGTPI